jgi:hypothetical protein
MDEVDGTQQILNMDEPDFPRPPLLVDDGFQRSGSGAMAAAGIEEHEVNLAHTQVK